MLLGILHAKETGISSGCLGLKLVCAITYLFICRPDDDRIVSHDAPRFMLYYHCVRDIS